MILIFLFVFLLFSNSQTENQDIYYFNFKTGESIWDHPCDEYYRRYSLHQQEKNAPKYRKQLDTFCEDMVSLAKSYIFI